MSKSSSSSPSNRKGSLLSTNLYHKNKVISNDKSPSLFPKTSNISTATNLLLILAICAVVGVAFNIVQSTHRDGVKLLVKLLKRSRSRIKMMCNKNSIDNNDITYDTDATPVENDEKVTELKQFFDYLLGPPNHASLFVVFFGCGVQLSSMLVFTLSLGIFGFLSPPFSSENSNLCGFIIVVVWIISALAGGSACDLLHTRMFRMDRSRRLVSASTMPFPLIAAFLHFFWYTTAAAQPTYYSPLSFDSQPRLPQSVTPVIKFLPTVVLSGLVLVTFIMIALLRSSLRVLHGPQHRQNDVSEKFVSVGGGLFCLIPLIPPLQLFARCLLRTGEIYDLFSLLTLAVLGWLICCSAIAIILMNSRIAKLEVPRASLQVDQSQRGWWWASFFGPSCCGIPLLLYFCYVFITYSDFFIDRVPPILFWLHVVALNLVYVLVSGVVGSVSSLVFLKSIYFKALAEDDIGHVQKEGQ